MNVAIALPYALWTPHVETDLEIAADHLEAGDRVTVVACDGSLDACDPNPTHERLECMKCRWTARAGLARLRGDVHVVALASLLDAVDRASLAELPRSFVDADALKAVTANGLDAGWAALSSVVWVHRDVDADLSSGEAARFLRASVLAYRATRNLIEREASRGRALDRIYTFNGRMAPQRGVLRAAQGAGVPCHVHERGRDIHHYALFQDCMPHEIAPTIERVHAAWESSELDDTARREVAETWYRDRVTGSMGSWVSFVESQAAGELPADWSPDRRNVVYFASTEYEYAAIGKEWQGRLFDGPTEAALEIAAELATWDGVDLTIRTHPNPTSAGSSSVQRMLALDLPNVRVVEPASSVSSYALVNAADVVVASSSTVGVEASFWGKPSIQVGRGIYSGLGAVYEPASLGELYGLLRDGSLAPKDPEPALRYGFYMATLGMPYRRFRAEGLFDGRFEGRRVRPSRWRRSLLRFLRKL